MNVIKTEQDFLKSQNNRRILQNQINEIVLKRNDINVELENTPRGQKKFLQLVTEEHEIIITENQLRSQLENAENIERETFSLLSSTLRESHEKERQQSEKTKYWSLGGSLIGATLGILGATFNNHLRNKEIRRVLNQVETINAGSPVNQDHLLTVVASFKEDLDRLRESGLAPVKSLDEKLDKLSVKLEKMEISKEKSPSLWQPSGGDRSKGESGTNRAENDKLQQIVLGSTSILCFSIALMIFYVTLSSATDVLV